MAKHQPGEKVEWQTRNGYKPFGESTVKQCEVKAMFFVTIKMTHVLNRPSKRIKFNSEGKGAGGGWYMV